MPQPLDAHQYAGPHPTCRELVQQLAAWGFTRRGDDHVHTLFRGPRGGTLKVIRSQLGRADPAVAEKAARLAGITPEQFWAGPEPVPAPGDAPRPAGAARRQPPARDSVIALVLSAHVAADRPLRFDQVIELAGGQVTRGQVSSASAALCRGGQLDRIRAGIYQWSASQRAARHVPAPRPAGGHRLSPPPPMDHPGRVSAAELFGQLFPDGVQMTAELLADLEQWARLTGKLTARDGAAS